jgi:hypothetical protein
MCSMAALPVQANVLITVTYTENQLMMSSVSLMTSRRLKCWTWCSTCNSSRVLICVTPTTSMTSTAHTFTSLSWDHPRSMKHCYTSMDEDPDLRDTLRSSCIGRKQKIVSPCMSWYYSAPRGKHEIDLAVNFAVETWILPPHKVSITTCQNNYKQWFGSIIVAY